MRDADVGPFVALLRDVYGIYPSAKPLTEGQVAMFIQAVRDCAMEAIQSALYAHARDPERGRYPPLPADVIAQILRTAASDGRPGPEEAWATALQGRDESSTIVWTTEMAEAWGIALPVLEAGDEVGARMAFREAYQRLIGSARSAGRLPKWSASLGFDVEQRERVLETAVTAGLLGAPDIAGLLPPPEVRAGGIAPEVREKLLALRERIVADESCESADAAAKRATAEMKAAAQQRVDAYLRGHA